MCLFMNFRYQKRSGENQENPLFVGLTSHLTRLYGSLQNTPSEHYSNLVDPSPSPPHLPCPPPALAHATHPPKCPSCSISTSFVSLLPSTFCELPWAEIRESHPIIQIPQVSSSREELWAAVHCEPVFWAGCGPGVTATWSP